MKFGLPLLFMAIYLDVAVNLFGVYVPGFTGLIVFFVCFGSLGHVILLVRFFLIFFVACVLSLVFTSANQETVKIISSAFQTIYSATVGFLLYMYIANSTADDMRKFSEYFFSIAYATLFLEYIGVISEISSSIGGLLYSGNVGFEYYGASDFALTRDIELSGGRRPTLFSPEPSIAAIGLSATSILLGVDASNNKKIFLSFASLALVWLLYNSPIPLLAIFFMISYVVFYKTGGHYVSLYFGGPVIIIALIGVYDRFSKILADPELVATSSEGIRTILPFENFFGSLLRGDFFGAGPGAVSDYYYIVSLNKYWTGVFGTNAVAQIFFYYGAVFGVLLIKFYWESISNALGKINGFGVVAAMGFVFVGFSLGAIESIRFFGFWSLVVSAAHFWLKKR